MDGIPDFGEDGFVFASFPSFHDESLAPEGKDSIQLIVGAPYMSAGFWEDNREQFADSVVKRAEHFIPGLSEVVELRLVATPQTLEKYTLNHAGAMYGWAPIPQQVGQGRAVDSMPFRGVSMVGHWSGPPAGTGGIPMAAYTGRTTANRILKQWGKCEALATGLRR